MFGDGLAILADDAPIGLGPHFDRPADGASRHAVLVAAEAHQTILRHRRLGGMEAIEAATVRYQEKGRSSANRCHTVLLSIVGCGRILASSMHRSISLALISTFQAPV